MNETTGVGIGLQPEKRIRRTVEEKLWIVEATLVPGASIARVAREHCRIDIRCKHRGGDVE